MIRKPLSSSDSPRTNARLSLLDAAYAFWGRPNGPAACQWIADVQKLSVAPSTRPVPKDLIEQVGDLRKRLADAQRSAVANEDEELLRAADEAAKHLDVAASWCERI